jgi:predicted phosphoadenosine phosphosulfate sulfurtransferase
MVWCNYGAKMQVFIPYFQKKSMDKVWTSEKNIFFKDTNVGEVLKPPDVKNKKHNLKNKEIAAYRRIFL